MTAVTSFCGLCLLVALGKLARVRIPLLQRLYLPSSVIGGLIGLVVLQAAGDHLPSMWTAGWARLPGFLINLVFAALFLGVAIPPLSVIWRKSGPQLAYGQIVAWGQYAVGMGLVLLVLGPLMGAPALLGVIVEVGFEGGHGTAAGLAETFAQLGWPEGSDFGLASATVGIVSAILCGMALVNWAARRGHVTRLRPLDTLSAEEQAGLYPVGSRPSAGRQTTAPESIDSLAMHLAILGVAVLAGYGLRAALLAVERAVPPLARAGVLGAFPLFPLCMLGGLAVQLVLQRAGPAAPVDRGLVQRLAGTALDFLVVAAISTIRLEALAEGLVPFAILVAAGIAWNVFCVVWLAPRLLPDAWFERAIAEMGQSMGVTATGLLLLRVADPGQDTDATAAFGYKQLLHEPFMGGGLWTSSAVLLVAHRGGPLVFGISLGAIAAWLLVWALLFRRRGAAAP
jgi:ESS family glutamate:Na+ symporter